MADSKETLGTVVDEGGGPPPPPMSEKDESAEKMTPPNGGLVAWLKVLATFFIFMNTWGIASAFGVFQLFYEKELLKTTSISSISWVGSVQAFLLVVVGVFAGPLFDLGYLRSLLVVGNFLIILGMFMLSLSTEYYQVFLAQGICFGLGSGMLYVPAMALVATEFTTKRAVAVGLASTGSSIGGIIYPIAFRRLQPVIGFPWTVRIIGFIAIGLAAIAIVLLTPRASQKKRKGQATRRQILQLRAFTEAPFALFSISLFFAFLAFWVPFIYIPTFASRALRTDEDTAFYMLCLLNAGSFFGRILPALAAQKLGPMQVFVAATVGATACLFGWLGVHNVPGFVAFAVLFGFCSGVLVSVPAATVTHPILSPSLGVTGTRLGMAWSFTGLGVLVGSPIAGALIDPDTADFFASQMFVGVCMAVAVLILTVPLVAIVRHDKGKKRENEINAAVAGAPRDVGDGSEREGGNESEAEVQEERQDESRAEQSAEGEAKR